MHYELQVFGSGYEFGIMIFCWRGSHPLPLWQRPSLERPFSMHRPPSDDILTLSGTMNGQSKNPNTEANKRSKIGVDGTVVVLVVKNFASSAMRPIHSPENGFVVVLEIWG